MLDVLRKRIGTIIQSIRQNKQISEDNIRNEVESIKIALLESDVNVRVVRRFVNHTIEHALHTPVLRSVSPGQQFVKIIHDRIIKMLGGETVPFSPQKGDTVLLLGLQGSGKTSSGAKLGLYFKKQGYKVCLIAADKYRPAAEEQLRILGKKIDVEVFTSPDPLCDTLKKGMKHAAKVNADLVIIDTAGRVYADEEMLHELKTISTIVRPAHKLLVIDAMTGQTATQVVQAFHEAVSVDGVVLSKFDSDAKGGAALSIAESTAIPIFFSGTGEDMEDMEVFHPQRIASRILGMGDITSLVEKAQQTIDEQEAHRLEEKIKKANITLNDYLAQYKALKKIGPLDKIKDMLPSEWQNHVSVKKGVNDHDLKREEAIILSMTKAERENDYIITPSRRRRIASGAGVTVFQVQNFLRRFAKARIMMKQMRRVIKR